MATLAEKLLTKDARPGLIQESAQLVDQEVADKSGLTGMAIKAAYGIVKAVKPGIIPEVLDSLMDDFVARLEPTYADYQAAQPPAVSFSAFVNGRIPQVADALLAITDDRAKVAKNQTLKKAYERLRPTGKKHVEAAVPRLGRMVEKRLG